MAHPQQEAALCHGSLLCVALLRHGIYTGPLCHRRHRRTHHRHDVLLHLHVDVEGDEKLKGIITNRKYMEPYKADKRKVIGLAIELDEEGKGLIDWKVAEEE